MQQLIQCNPIIGISACLMGHKVRFDGGHKQNAYTMKTLSKFVTFTTVCPEMGAGLPSPRPAMQLKRAGKDIRLVISKDTSIDKTSQLQSFAEKTLPNLAELDGFIFKKDSPSCGVFKVPVVTHDNGNKQRIGTGVFAKAFMAAYPLVPVEEEGRLNDAQIRENFFERVYAYQRWRLLEENGCSVQQFIDFHAQHKLMLMARGSHFYQELGRMVSGVTAQDLSHRRDAYIKRFMVVMAKQSKRGRQVNVLQHILGYFKKHLSADDKQELLAIFESYRQAQLPLITAITMIRHHLKNIPNDYLARQHYLAPFPEQLGLRSSV